MLDYVDSKERQGVFFEKPSEKIHLPEPAELALMDHSKWWFDEIKDYNFNPSFHSEESEPVAAVSVNLLSSKATVRWPKKAMQWQVLTSNSVVFAFLLQIASAFSPHFQLLCEGLQR